MKYIRKEIDGGIGITFVMDEKFKTGCLTVRFITKLGDDAAQNALGISVLNVTNSKCRSITEFNEKLGMLFGASAGTFVRKRGDVQILGISASWVSSRYALEGVDTDQQMIEIVRDCIFSPDAENGAFSDKPFRITKKDLLDHIGTEIDNKRNYALMKAAETAFCGEPAGSACYGTKEAAEKITASSAFEAYRKILETARVEIFFSLPYDRPDAIQPVIDGFTQMSRRPQDIDFRKISPAKETLSEVREDMEMQQSKMVMVFKSGSEDVFAMKMMSIILGESPVSRLFVNVREKMGLCYYCVSRFVSSKNTLMVDCGVSEKDTEKAKEAIAAQIEDISSGNISDEDIERAIALLETSVESLGDSQSSYSGWYFESFCDGYSPEPEEYLANFRSVTKERIAAAARSLVPDTVYILCGREDGK